MTGKERLTILRDALLDFPKDIIGFDMNVWHCGTKCCAGGLACTLPLLQKEGLHFTRSLRREPEFTDDYADWLGMYALARFFDLSHENTEWLFRPDRYPENMDRVSEFDVADRINQVLETMA